MFGSKEFNLPDVFFPVAFVQVQRLLLGRAFNIWLILDQLLDAQQDLLDRNVRFPVLLVVEDRKTDCSRRVDVGMGQHRLKHAFRRSSFELSYLTG